MAAPLQSPVIGGVADPARKCALIIGASSGIGAEFARQLAGKGYDLIVVARRLDRLQQLCDELSGRHGVKCEAVQVDLTDSGQLADLEERITNSPPLDILVNNAGFGSDGPFHASPLSFSQSMLDVHVTASTRLAHAALGGMLARGRGGIINVASLAAFITLPGYANYCATKAYLVMFSRALDAEVRRKGVRVQALCPGFIVTEFQGRAGRSESEWRLPAFMLSRAQGVVSTSLRDLDRGRTICVPGFVSKLIYAAARPGLLDLPAAWFLRT